MNSKTIIICIVMVLALSVSPLYMSAGFVYAQEYDESRQGSITIELDDIDTDFSDVVFICYKVADPVPGAETNWATVPGLEGIASDFFHLENAQEMHEAAGILKEKAATAALPGIEAKTGSTGRAVFSSLDLGVYLVVQKDTADYGIVEPFLVTVPYTSEGSQWVYDVHTQTKGERLEEETQSAPPHKESKPPAGTVAKTGDDFNITFVAIFAVLSGMICIISGFVYLKREKSKSK